MIGDWINVEDRLPNLDEPVWIYWKNREVVIGHKTAIDCEPSECWYSYQGGDKCKWTNYWMPIDKKIRPKPPEESC